MANDIIGVSIKAFEEFEDAFRKFQSGLKQTEQAEQQVVEATESVNEAMFSLIQAKKQAQEASEKFNKVLADMSRNEKQTAETTERFDEAFRELANAEKAVEQQTEKVNAAMKAQGVEGKQAQSVLKHLDNQMKENSRSARSMQGSMDDLIGVLGQVGVLYAFSQGLREILNIGKELESQLTKVAAITDESVDVFAKFIGGNKGSLFAPAEQAKAMIDLGAAGLKSAEMLKALPEVFDLATAGLVNLEQAVPPVLNVIKTFERPIEESGHIVDAFVEAANRSALQVEDLSLSMAMSSAAAKLAGMDYQELIATLMILRDAGLQASDAGTSIKSALLAMMNPSKEATDYMNQLGIEIYDAQGNMKSWADIVGEFERGLTGLTEKEKNLVLSTIAGSDGIRALSLSMGRGSEFIRQTTVDLQNADGAAREVAATMEQTFDATLKKTINNLQLMAATIFSDAEPAMTSLLGGANDLIEGFAGLDESTRKSIEFLVGSVGLAAAIITVISVVQRLTAALKVLQLASGPWGLLIFVASGLAMSFMQAAGATEEMKRKQEELNRATEEFNRIRQNGIDKSKIDANRQRIQVLDEEIKKLREYRDELIIQQNLGHGQNSKVNTELGRVNQEILKRANEQRVLNDEIAKTIALDAKGAIETANKATQTKIETEATVNLIDEYLKLESQQNLTSAQQQRLADLAGTLGQKYQYLVTAIDENGRATKLNSAALENQKKILQGLAQAEMDNARATMQANLAKTQVVLAEAKKRINILLQEQQALQTVNGQWSTENWFQQGRSALSEEIKNQQKALDEASQAATIYKSALESLDKVKVGGGVSTKTLDTGKGGGSKSKSTGPDPFTEAMNLFNYQKELSDMSTEFQIANLQKIRDAFIRNGKWTLDQHRQIDVQIIQLQRQRMQEQLNYSKTWIETQKGLNQLSTEDEIAAWERVKAKYKLTREEMMQIDVTIYQLQEQARQEQVEKAKAWIDEQVFYERMSVAQQISAWEDLKSSYNLTADEIKEIDRTIFSLRKEMLNDYTSELRESYSRERDAKLESLKEEEEAELDSLDRRRKEYEKNHKARLEQLDEETDAAIKALQDQIDAIENLNKQDEQAKKEQDRNKELADLQTEFEKYRYATSEAGKKKREEIEQAIADIQYEIQKEANEKARQEQIDALKDEMDNIKNQAEEKKKQWQEQYEQQQEWYAEEQESIRDHYARVEETTRKHYDNLISQTNLQAEAQKALQEQKQQETITMLESFAPQYLSAGALLGGMFADGIMSQMSAVISAASSLASAASDYLELHSPAKKGPLSTLDEWWKPMGQMLAGGIETGPVAAAAGDMAGAAVGSGGSFTLEVNIQEFYGTRENIDELSAGLKRTFDFAVRSRGGRG